MRPGQRQGLVFMVGAMLEFAGCAAPSHVTPTAANAGVSASRLAALLPAPKRARLFVSTGRQNLIQIYDAASPYQLLGQITDGLAGPNDLAVDASGNLYVANADGGWVTVYPPGATKPSMTYTKGLSNPLTPAIGSDGTLYVSNFNPDGSGEILEFPPHHRVPTFEIPLSGGAVGVALDSHNNLYVSTYGSTGRILKFAPNSKTGKDLGISLVFAGRLAVDAKGNIIVCDQGVPAVDFFPLGATKPSKQITTGFVDPFAVVLNKNFERLFVADGAGKAVNVYSYPQLKLLSAINRSATSYGLSINPPARL